MRGREREREGERELHAHQDFPYSTTEGLLEIIHEFGRTSTLRRRFQCSRHPTLRSKERSICTLAEELMKCIDVSGEHRTKVIISSHLRCIPQ